MQFWSKWLIYSIIEARVVHTMHTFATQCSSRLCDYRNKIEKFVTSSQNSYSDYIFRSSALVLDFEG